MIVAGPSDADVAAATTAKSSKTSSHLTIRAIFQFFGPSCGSWACKWGCERDPRHITFVLRMLNIRTSSTKILALLSQGQLFSGLVLLTTSWSTSPARDMGINGTFWFRFIYNLIGLTLVTLAASYYIPTRFRLAGSIAADRGLSYLLMSPVLPDIRRAADGHDVMPFGKSSPPYQEPKERRRSGRSARPELALKAKICGF